MMNQNKNNFTHKLYKSVMPKVYGIGAAVVILGAMFKLLNWPGGGLMLGIGLSTEAIIFILSSFEPQTPELDWTRPYPELKEDYAGPLGVVKKQDVLEESISSKLDDLFAKAKIDGALVDKLGDGMRALIESTQHIASLTHTAQASQQFTAQLEKAAENLEKIYEAPSGVLEGINKIDGLVGYSKEFYEQLHNITQTLSRANTIYATDLQDLNEQLVGTKTAYASLTETIYQLQTASSQTERFRKELAALNEKLSSLNSVYENMLLAFKS